MFGGVKITLILCVTMVVCCVLFISYNEYTNRYALLTNNDNSVYIFDKKSTILNKCNEKSCSVIETKLPTQTRVNFEPIFQQSKLFDTSNRPMTNEVNEKISEGKLSQISETSKEKNTTTIEAKPVEPKKVAEKATEKKEQVRSSSEESKTETTEKRENKNKSKEIEETEDKTQSSENKPNTDDEFVE